ncbi:olfactory receptor 5B12-like [Trichosurus vulpecula]|uniref:olfactory receptor 5B12-like n=1 Tax=Trichosurus vulpecula TaxID=9337 RepID=UPI00186AECF4|nr:olfactory receptor 5B12-like [Trichosurus vulpecula]
MASMENRTQVNAFILLGLTNAPELQKSVFMLFTIIYLITVVENLGMVTLISWDSHLHTPMYFFLSNLYLVDFGYSSAITPKVIAGCLTGNNVISYNGCVTQMLFFLAFGSTENWLLATMAYDCHATVSRPLHYTTTMTTRVCAGLIIASHSCGFLNAAIHTGNTFSLSFCNSNVIHHFFCDIPPLLDLSCSDSYTIEWVLFIVGGFNAFFAILVIFTSYSLIFLTILRIRSLEGRQKAFSTCASHLTAVSIFYGSTIFTYLQPSSNHSMDMDKMASVFYTMVIPMLNPLIYSLRNKEVKSAFKKAAWRQRLS